MAASVFAVPSAVKALTPVVQDFGQSIKKTLFGKDSSRFTHQERGDANIFANEQVNLVLAGAGLPLLVTNQQSGAEGVKIAAKIILSSNLSEDHESELLQAINADDPFDPGD